MVQVYSPIQDLNITTEEIRNKIRYSFEEQDLKDMPKKRSNFDGCGVYALYYDGDCKYYETISGGTTPIYVGKAMPSGVRTGLQTVDPLSEDKIYKRLREHYRSIEEVENLHVSDFTCRYMVCEILWTRYIEQTLITEYSPWWNKYIEGFGLHDPGKGRSDQKRSVWDTLHPGRSWVEKRELELRGTPEDVWKEIKSDIDTN